MPSLTTLFTVSFRFRGRVVGCAPFGRGSRLERAGPQKWPGLSHGESPLVRESSVGVCCRLHGGGWKNGLSKGKVVVDGSGGPLELAARFG